LSHYVIRVGEIGSAYKVLVGKPQLELILEGGGITLRVFENRIVRRIFEPKRDEVTG
jgi:hypothetical protein